MRAGSVRSVSWPSTTTRPAKRPPWKWGTRPQSARSSVDLPSPEGPSSSSTSPAAHVEVDAVERRRGARRRR